MKGARWVLIAAVGLAGCGGSDGHPSTTVDDGFNADAVMVLLRENFHGASDTDLQDELDVWRHSCTDELTRELEVALRMIAADRLGGRYIAAGCPDRYALLAG